jgi:hypothetical protein
MVATGVISKAEDKSVVLDPLNSRASEQLEELLERRPLNAEAEMADSTAWGYRIPSAGVRYYTY